jgi:predicted dehydrogenase
VTAYARYGDLLDHCDAVTFAVPAGPQASLATAAVQRGRAVLLELPIGGDLAEAEQLVDAVDRAGVTSQVALTWRYSTAVRAFLTGAVPRVRPLGGSGRLVSCVLARGPLSQQARLERGVLLDQGPDLVDLLDAALGRVVGVRAHGDPLGWVGLLLEHAGGRFSEASLCATADVQPNRAEVEVFGPGGAAAVDCAGAVGPDTYDTMIGEFAKAVEHHTPHALDARRGLHLQEVLGRAELDLFSSA